MINKYFNNINVNKLKIIVFLFIFFILHNKSFAMGAPILLKNINPSGGSAPNNFLNINSTVYFSATNGTNGVELWKSDGTAEGTVMVKDINPSGDSSPSYLTNVNGVLFFKANNGTNGAELWKSDGTAEGTVMVKDIHPGQSVYLAQLTNVNGILYFKHSDGTHGIELWKSDGTAEGTVMVKDINPSGDSNPYYLTNVNGALYFRAHASNMGSYELWKSDGTEMGTIVVNNPVSYGPAPEFLTIINDEIFLFSGYSSSYGKELWKSDGTAEGTVMVKNIMTGSGNSNPSYLTNVNGTLYFSAYSMFEAMELWKSDGTAGGTVIVKDIWSSFDSSNPSYLTNVNGTLYFRANNGTNGVELWKSDGTAGGTVMVKDLCSGEANSNPAYLVSADETLYFSGTNGGNGTELWKSDGTAEGTVMVKDINPSGDSSPSYLTNVNGALYFSADDGINGTELWVLFKDITPPTIIGISNDTTPRKTKTWTWDSDDPTATYRYVVNQNATHNFTDEVYGTTTSTTQSSGNGTYYLHVQAKDEADNTSNTSVSAILDNMAPIISGLSDDNTSTVSKNWIWSSDDENAVYRYHVTTTDSFVFSDEEYSTTTSTTQSSGDGIYYLYVQAKDMADNISTSTVSAILDNTAPTITILGSNPTSIFLEETYTDSGATATDNIDENIAVTTSGTVNTSQAGTYTITYSAIDIAGNISTSTRIVNVINRPSSAIPLFILESMNDQNQNNQNQEEYNNEEERQDNNQTLEYNNAIFTNGSFIKTNNASTVYFIDTEKNMRHVYPNEAVWRSYFGKDFSFVETKNNINFSDYTLGKNVTFKKGTLFKIPSVSRVYLTDNNGIIHWIKTEAKAIELYGKNWNKLVYDLSEAFFGDYIEGSEVE